MFSSAAWDGRKVRVVNNRDGSWLSAAPALDYHQTVPLLFRASWGLIPVWACRCGADYLIRSDVLIAMCSWPIFTGVNVSWSRYRSHVYTVPGVQSLHASTQREEEVTHTQTHKLHVREQKHLHSPAAGSQSELEPDKLHQNSFTLHRNVDLFSFSDSAFQHERDKFKFMQFKFNLCSR